jgi:hypothetical protein
MTEEKKQETTLLEWQAPEFSFVERKAGWYVTGGIILLALVVLLVVWKQWLLLVVVVLLAVVVLQYSLIKPKEITFKITSEGLYAGGKPYKFSDFKSFWISPEGKTLNFIRKKRLALSLILPLPENQTDKVRKILTNYLTEEAAREETPIDRLSRILKF